MIPTMDLNDLGRLMRFSRIRAKSEELKIKRGKHAGPKHHAPELKLYQQRVVVKAALVKARRGGKTLQSVFQRHIDYIGRDKTGMEGQKPELFTKSNETIVPTQEINNEKHFFKFIVSPERGSQIDLKDYTRDIMTEAETTLGKKLDWVASCHYNTDNPHVHIVVRGVSEGKELRIDRQFISQGFRDIATERATRELGHRTSFDIEAQRAREIVADRFTLLDRQLKSTIDRHNVVAPTSNTLVQRCEYLNTIGCAMRYGKDQYVLSDNFEQILKNNGYREDVHKRMYHDIPNNLKPVFIYDESMKVSGKIVAREFENEHFEKPYVFIETKENKLYYMADYKLSRAKVDQEITVDLGKIKLERIQETTKGIER